MRLHFKSVKDLTEGKDWPIRDMVLVFVHFIFDLSILKYVISVIDCYFNIKFYVFVVFFENDVLFPIFSGRLKILSSFILSPASHQDNLAKNI